MPIFDFRLKPPTLELEENSQSLTWPALAEAEFWMETAPGRPAIFEYSNQGHRETGRRYATYQFDDVLENLAGLFPAVAEPIPGDLFGLVRTSQLLTVNRHRVDAWLESQSDNHWADAHEALVRWVYSRQFTVPPVADGPELWFFRDNRQESNVVIVWRSDAKTASGDPLWANPSGEIEIPFVRFVSDMRSLFTRFFLAMTGQIDRATALGGKKSSFDRERLGTIALDLRAALEPAVGKLVFEGDPQTDFQRVREALIKAGILQPASARAASA